MSRITPFGALREMKLALDGLIAAVDEGKDETVALALDKARAATTIPLTLPFEAHMNALGMAGVLADCAVHLGNGDSADEMRERIEVAIGQAATIYNLRVRWVLHRCEIEPIFEPA